MAVNPAVTGPAVPDARCVIVGGGVVGSAAACFLVNQRAFTGRVIVIERDPTYREASTPRSVGGIRHQFSTAANVRISRFATDFVRNPSRFVRTERTSADLAFVENGYLMLASRAGAGMLERNVALQRELGADVAMLGPAALGKRFPWLNIDDIALGAHGASGEGWIDPHALLNLFREAAIAGGARYVTGEVTSFQRVGDRITAACCGNGETIAADVFVNAAGASAATLCDLARCTPPPVAQRKRQVFVFHCRTPIDRGCPLVVDPSGTYFRPEGTRFVCGLSPPPDADPDCDDFEIDYSWFEDRLWPLLAHRVPAFEAVRVTGAWAGHYDYNTFDQNAIIGRHWELENFFLANGFSGHGLQQSPAVGRALAELIVAGHYTSLDLSIFSPDRIARGAPVVEKAVV